MSESLRSIEKNRLIIEIAVDAIISISSRGLIETFNPAAEKLFGYTAEEIIGQNINGLMPEPYASQHDAFLEHYLQTGKQKIIGIGRHVQAQRKNGQIFDAFLSVGEMEMNGQISFVGIIRDITVETSALKELQASYLELEKKKQEIQEKSDEILRASQYKSEFLSNMSHELRSPLNSLLILAKMLSENENGHLSEDEVESANIIHSSGQDLLKLINDILDLSKVEAGKLHLEKRQFFIKHLQTSLSGQFKKLAEKKQIQFTILIEPSVPDKICTDDHRLMQILKNLISNAFKFTHKGAVSVTISLTDDSDLMFRITDSGIGIPADKLNDIFNAFHQVDGTISRRYGGTGLGLSISNALAHLLGGKIEVTSEPGLGSSFTLILSKESVLADEKNALDQHSRLWQAQDLVSTLPDYEDPETMGETMFETMPETRESMSETGKTVSEMGESGAGQAINHTDETLSGKKILLVDDDLRNTFSLSQLLSARGCQVSIADNGELALKKLALKNYDVVLMDMIMPVLDGYQSIKKIRQNPDWQALPIIAITAKAMPEDKQKCLDAGASDYLPKPVDVDKLLELISNTDFPDSSYNF